MKNKFYEYLVCALKLDFGKTIKKASDIELYSCVGKAFNACCDDMLITEEKSSEKRACYFSAEFLLGKLTKANLFNLGLLSEAEEILNQHGRSLENFENFDDPALGNGGLGRLAACFMDSAAGVDIPLDGYGIRYKYGYFKQIIDNDRQKEEADDWLRFTDSFGRRTDSEAVEISFRNEKVRAIPYIYFVPGYKNNRINKLCLFQAEAGHSFDYATFDSGDFAGAFAERNCAEEISATLYPNDNTEQGKVLRLKQQYFFTSAALQLIIKKHISCNRDVGSLPDFTVIQLNDTHPVVAIPECIRIIMSLGKSFDEAFSIAEKIFAYTNHTVLAEALEKWDEKLFLNLIPDIYEIIKQIDKKLLAYLKKNGREAEKDDYLIISNGLVRMANLACFVAKSVNGVAKIHSEIIKNDTLSQWYKLFPEKFNNKTNGVTQRRWLALSNPELCRLLEEKCGADCISDFKKIKKLEDYADDKSTLEQLMQIKYENKKRLCNYIYQNEHIKLDPDFVFCVQIKRLHEYKRQLMNILSVIDIYFRLKSGKLADFNPTVFIIGAKAAPGYKAAKRIIEFINAVSHKINADEETSDKLKIVFVSNYNVSYAEKIIPAADISEQISLAGKEASGTSNMKFMMNGAVTLGTYDGANIEIVEKAGEENNFIFGLREEQVRELQPIYDPKKEYEANENTKRAVDTLKNKVLLPTGSETFEDLFLSLTTEDRYMTLKDLPAYTERKLDAIYSYSDKYAFQRRALMNIANSFDFSSDRTITEYAKEIWFN